MKNASKLVAILGILIALVLVSSFVYYNVSLEPVSRTSQLVDFEVEKGTSDYQVIKQLDDKGIIKSDFAAKIYLKLGGSANFKAGLYQIDTSLSTPEIIDYLSDASNTINDDAVITFIEGDWAKEMARKLSEETNLNDDDLLEYWDDEEVVRELMTTYPFLQKDMINKDVRILLEGYLFPNTYSFHRTTTLDEVTRRLLDETAKVYETYQDQIETSSFSVHELFTLASIVQYEARSVEDMKMIAGVLLNRLEVDMPLQVSASVCYAIDLAKGDDWRKCESNPTFESPYNTYKYKGLPPGAIMSFGKDALDAVLNPTDSNYYYFVADVYGDGSVHYAETYKEHLKNVEKFGL